MEFGFDGLRLEDAGGRDDGLQTRHTDRLKACPTAARGPEGRAGAPAGVGDKSAGKKFG